MLLAVPIAIITIVFVFWYLHCSAISSITFSTCSETMLQQLTSYYETMITVLVIIITILLATSFVSIYYVTKRQVKSTIEEVVIETVDAEFKRNSFIDRIEEKVKEFCQSPEGLDLFENNPEYEKEITNLKGYYSLLYGYYSSLDDRISVILQDLQELKDKTNNSNSKRTNSKRRTDRSSKNGIQETDNKQQD